MAPFFSFGSGIFSNFFFVTTKVTPMNVFVFQTPKRANESKETGTSGKKPRT
jgi:hypothetical protein